MAMFTVQEILRAAQGALVAGDLAVPVTGVSIDSRTLAVGDAFVAIRGHHLDGHAFLVDAAGRGAACLVVHTLSDDVPGHVPLILVEDTTVALGRLAAWHRAKFSIPVVAVTGSNGKTTTKEMIAALLATRWRTHRPQASFNNQWGLPLTILRLAPEHQALVVEIGANQPGEIAALAAIAQPTVAVVTMVAPVHTEFFGSIDGVREEKAALVRAVPADGHVVLNADDPRVASMARDTAATVLTYGGSAAADVRAIGDVVEDPDGLRFVLQARGDQAPVRLAFPGRHNVANALAAAAVGVALGVRLDEIARGLGNARPVAGRCVWRRAGDVLILDDTYNANPVSVRAALDTLGAPRGAGRLIVVLGDMLELGATTDEAHREIGREIAGRGVTEFVGVGRYAALAVAEARDAGLENALHTASFDDTVAHLLKRLGAGDVVLVKGSRGMRMERVVDALVARLARVSSGSGHA
jgi:UDP-N-acetylmuramoyl-tripeptide--D-alanyl-D-alanine ligase